MAGINVRPFAKHFLQRLQHEVADFAGHGGLGFCRIGSSFLWWKRLLYAAADWLADCAADWFAACTAAWFAAWLADCAAA